MFVVVGMRNHRNKGADFAVFGSRGTSEDGKVGIAGKIARASNTVHHLSAQYVGAVYVAENVGLQSRVDGNQPHAACQFGRIGNFLRPEDQSMLEKSQFS